MRNLLISSFICLSLIGYSQSFENGKTYYSSDNSVSDITVTKCCDPVHVSVSKRGFGNNVSIIKLDKTEVPGLFKEKASSKVDYFYFPPGGSYGVHYQKASVRSSRINQNEVFLIHTDKKQLKSVPETQLIADANQAESKMDEVEKNAIKKKIMEQEIPIAVVSDKPTEAKMLTAIKEYNKSHSVSKELYNKIVITQKDFTVIPAYNNIGNYGRSKSAVVFYKAGSDGFCTFETIDFIQKDVHNEYEKHYTVLGEKISKPTKFDCAKLK